MNNIIIPIHLTKPILWFSVLITSYNTKRSYIKDCLHSILNQTGWFGIELVWCNDGSDTNHTSIVEEELSSFLNRSRFITIIYYKNEKNVGISESLHYGLLKCTNELIYRMDSDDIMVTNRMQIQYNFMLLNKNAVICGGGIEMFDSNGNTKEIHHPTITISTWNETETKNKWIMNHPTLCFRKEAILSIGNYEIIKSINEDYNLEIKILQKYGTLYNLPQILLYYRIHEEQITFH